MASVKSPLRTIVKPILFKLLGKRGYKWAQFYGKKKDIKKKLVEEREMELLPIILGKNDETLDIGANYAYYTERLARLVPGGHVYAFEPIPFTFEVAKMIVNSFKLKNVDIYQKGVGSKTEVLKFSVPKQGFGVISAGQAHITGRNNEMIKGSNYFISDQNEEFDCEVIDIDTFLLPRLKNLTFIKIDIEGAEYFALKGMEKTIQQFKPVILIEIVPLFLKSFKIENEFFQKYIQKDLGYVIYEYDSVTKKLQAIGNSITKDRNYILIHENKVSQYKHLIS